MNSKSRTACAMSVLIFLLALAAVPGTAQGARGAEWTILVYLDGDNNLDSFAALDIEEMKMVGSTSKVNVLVLWDRYDAPANVYKVVKNDLVLMKGLKVYGVPVNGHEVYMADWHVLEAFVDYGIAKLPAKHYMVVVWDHCDGYGLCCEDDHWEAPWYPAVERMTLAQVQDALAGSGTIDVLAYDACLVGMVEIAYELSTTPPEKAINIQYLVGTEGYAPDYGYPYNTILAKMNSGMDLSNAGTVAMMVCDKYAEAYSAQGQYGGGSTANLSAIKLSEVGDAIPVLDTLTGELVARLVADYDYWHELLSLARGDGNLPWSENGWDLRVDIIKVMMSLSSRTNDATISVLANSVATELTEAVYVANTDAMASAGAHGLAVYFPVSYSSLGNTNAAWYPLEDYPVYFKFAQDAGWLSFLYAYWDYEPGM